MRRYGPLHSTAEGVLLGDPGRNHILFAPAEIQHRDRAAVSRRFAWNDVERVRIDVPTTRFRFPGAVAAIGSAILVAIVQDDPNLGPAPGVARVCTAEAEVALPLDRHHFGGYWSPTVLGAQRMVDRLIEEPDSRELLHHPESLLRAVVGAARNGS